MEILFIPMHKKAHVLYTTGLLALDSEIIAITINKDYILITN